MFNARYFLTKRGYRLLPLKYILWNLVGFPYRVVNVNVADVNLFYLVNESEAHETTAGKHLVQGCYAVAWVGAEPTTCELQGKTLSTEPRRHSCVSLKQGGQVSKKK